MSSLYAQYIKERENFEIIEDEFGFATYKIQGEECYLRDIYVVPEQRKTAIATSYLNAVIEKAKKAGCKVITGTVAPKANNSSESMMAVLKSGFKIHSASAELIVLVRGI